MNKAEPSYTLAWLKYIDLKEICFLFYSNMGSLYVTI